MTLGQKMNLNPRLIDDIRRMRKTCEDLFKISVLDISVANAAMHEVKAVATETLAAIRSGELSDEETHWVKTETAMLKGAFDKLRDRMIHVAAERLG